MSHEDQKSQDRWAKQQHGSKHFENLQKTLQNYIKRGVKSSKVKQTTKKKNYLSTSNIDGEKNFSPPPQKMGTITIEKVHYNNDKDTPRLPTSNKDSVSSIKRNTPPAAKKKSVVSGISGSKHMAQFLTKDLKDKDSSHSRLKRREENGDTS